MNAYRHGLTALIASAATILSGMMAVRGFDIFYAPLLIGAVLTGYHGGAAVWGRG